MQHNSNALNSPPPHENNLGKRATSLDCITDLYIITPNSEIARPWPELSRQLTHSPLLMREKSAIIALRRARSKSIFRLHAMRLFPMRLVIVWDKKKTTTLPIAWRGWGAYGSPIMCVSISMTRSASSHWHSQDATLKVSRSLINKEKTFFINTSDICLKPTGFPTSWWEFITICFHKK